MFGLYLPREIYEWEWFPFAFIGGILLGFGFLAWMVIASNAEIDAMVARHEAKWGGAVLVRVCKDGTRVYRLRDGEHWTGGSGSSLVDNPATICG